MVNMLQQRLAPQTDIQVANAEQLPYGDATFDAYTACLALMITPDAPKMLAEACRVLKPGGAAAFAVWGRKEASPMMAIPPASLKACGLETSPKRSNFHLGGEDTSALRAMVLNAGFGQMRTWRVHAVLPGAASPDAYLSLMAEGSPSFGALLGPLAPSDKTRVEAEMRRRAAAVLEGGEAIGCDILLFVATKPGGRMATRGYSHVWGDGVYSAPQAEASSGGVNVKPHEGGQEAWAKAASDAQARKAAEQATQ